MAGQAWAWIGEAADAASVLEQVERLAEQP